MREKVVEQSFDFCYIIGVFSVWCLCEFCESRWKKIDDLGAVAYDKNANKNE